MILVLATRNQGKLNEIKNMLSDQMWEIKSLNDFPEIGEIPETGATFRENAAIKARTVFQKTGCLCLADDSGLQVDALAGAPGVYSARFAGMEHNDEANNHKLLQMISVVPLANRTARFRCVMALIGPQHPAHFFDGVCEGLITDLPRGENGFGYDPLFYLPQLNKCMAELTTEEKNKISHRGKALRQAVDYLQSLND